MHYEFRALDTALKNQLVSMFKYAYILLLRNVYTGYAEKATLEIITHLYSN